MNRAAHERSRRDLAPGRAPARAKNATLQIGRVRPTVRQRPRHRLQHFCPERHLTSRSTLRKIRDEAMAHWQAAVAEALIESALASFRPLPGNVTGPPSLSLFTRSYRLHWSHRRSGSADVNNRVAGFCKDLLVRTYRAYRSQACSWRSSAPLQPAPGS